MKKITLLSAIFILLTTVSLYAGGNPRSYIQKLVIEEGDILDIVQTLSPQTDPAYVVRSHIQERPADIMGTDLGTPASSLRICKMGNGTTQPYFAATALQLSSFAGVWTHGETIVMSVEHIATGETVTWTIVIPPTNALMLLTGPGEEVTVGPFPVVGEDFTLGVTSNWAGAAIYHDGMTTGQVTPYTFDPAAAGTYTLVMDDITWTPAEYVYAAEADETFAFVGVFTPEVATNPVPADGTTLTWADGVTEEVILSWDPVAGVDYYNVYWNGATEAAVANNPTWTTPEIGAGVYTWQVVPYVNDPIAAKRVGKVNPNSMKLNSRNASPKGGAVGAPIWEFTIEYAPVIVPELTITSDPTGATVVIDGEMQTYTTPTNATVAGTYSVFMPNYTWEPVEYIWDGLADAAVEFVGTEVIVPPEYDIPEGGSLLVNGVTVHMLTGNANVITDPAYELPALADPTVEIFPVVLELVDPAPWSITFDTDNNYAFYHNGEWLALNVDGELYTFTLAPTPSKEPVVIPFVFSMEDPTVFDTTLDILPNHTLTYVDHSGNTTLNLTGSAAGFQGANYIPAPFTPAPNISSFTMTQEDKYDMVGYGDVTIYVTTFEEWFMYKLGNENEWHVYHASGIFNNQPITFNIGTQRNQTFEWKTGYGEDPTLPVELSLFNAVLTAGKFVELTWISESETNMMGYRVYRNETQDAANATLITPTMVPATNTSSTQVYNHTDLEVSGGHTYYYWLEAADYGHSTMFGPQYVTIPVDTTPELPVQTAMRNAYPNPFKANTNTNIDVSVKAGENGTVTIYNVLGQVVQSYRVGEGTHNLKWNGHDTRGNTCGSGIYFYKLSTPSMNQTKKMVIVK